VSIVDPDARPIRKGKLGKPNEFGFVAQICEVTENTRTGARGLSIPAASSQLGNPTEDTLLPDTVAEPERLGLSPREVALDGGFNIGPTRQALETLDPERTVHRRPPTTRQPTNAAPPGPLPNRQRGPHQTHETRLRAAHHCPPIGLRSRVARPALIPDPSARSRSACRPAAQRPRSADSRLNRWSTPPTDLALGA
jgi:hypothetical protein